jgi:hypothetical protein
MNPSFRIQPIRVGVGLQKSIKNTKEGKFREATRIDWNVEGVV